MSAGGPREILRQYLELCASGIHRLEEHLASNAILEWKGVTVKGRSRIVKFMRHKQQDGLVQRFSNVEAVQAFEERESHLSTMCPPLENLIVQSTADHRSDPARTDSHKESPSPDMNLSFETPPRVHPISSDPPPLTAGRQFLPLSSSDEEDDSLPPQLTPESPTPSNEPPRVNAYSELQYLEAIGIVRSTHESKHRGTRTSHHIPREDTPPSADPRPTTPTNAGSADSPDNRTKLKLSYRTHRQSAEPQFALVIYEDQSPRTSKVRRNLFADEADADEPEPSSPVRAPPPASDSPEARPLPDTPPPVPSTTPPPGEITPPQTPLEPPGTPHRQRRFPPVGFRTSPRRSRAIMNFTAITSGVGDGSNSSSSSSSSSGAGGGGNNNNNNLQTWPRKTHPGGGSPGGGTSAKNRKLATGATTVRKPLRF